MCACSINCPLSKGNQAPHPKIERPNGKKHKIQNFFEIGPKCVPPFSLESSMKRILRRFESNQNKSKQMKINDVFDHFTSKA